MAPAVSDRAAPAGRAVIVRGRHVVCRVRPDGTPAIVDGGGVLVRAGVIVEVASFEALARTDPHATVIGDGGDLVFPGLVLIDWRAVGGAYLDPETPVLEALLHRGKASAVHTSMVGGRVVLREGRAAGVDVAAVRAEIARQLGDGPTDAERGRRDLARRLLPHVRDFYRGWPVPDHGARWTDRGEARP